MIFPLYAKKQSGTGNIAMQINDLRQSIRAVSPVRSSGTWFNRTTVGTIRKAAPQRAQAAAQGGAAVWL